MNPIVYSHFYCKNDPLKCILNTLSDHLDKYGIYTRFQNPAVIFFLYSS